MCSIPQVSARRSLAATTDTTDIEYAISVPDNDDDSVDLADLISSQLSASISSGAFDLALQNATSSSSVLAAAATTSAAVHKHTFPPSSKPTRPPAASEDGGLSAAAVAAILLAAIALAGGAYLAFFKEGFCFNNGPKAEAAAGGQEIAVAKTNDVDVIL